MPMGRSGSSAVLRQIHTLFTAGSFSGLSDQQLLERFVACRDAASESAFTVLVQRHGPMVLGVCRRMLADPHDAEDAFQATFLVLVRKARSIKVDGSVGRWLFGVAARVAARARENSQRRRVHERTGLDLLDRAKNDAGTIVVDRAEIQAILAEEVGKLPAKFQAAVLLCDLEGRSHEDAARRLGWPVGTVKSRLCRARARLRRRLTRRGFAPEGIPIAVPLFATALPRKLVETTTQAALSLLAGRPTTSAVVTASVTKLTEGVLRTMFLTKIKLPAVALLVILTGSAALLGQATGQKASQTGEFLQSLAPRTGDPEDAARRNDELDIEVLERAWVDAIPRRDASIINRIMADDFEGIDPVANVFTKSTYMPDLAHGVFSKEPIELDEIKARVFGDAAVATSRIKIAGYLTSGRMTNVYVKRQGRWQCVASHASGMAATASPKVGAAAHQELLKNYLQQVAVNDRLPYELATSCTSCHTSNTQFGIILPRSAAETPRVLAGPRDKQGGETSRLPSVKESADPERQAGDMKLRDRSALAPVERATSLAVKFLTKAADRTVRLKVGFPCSVEKVLLQVGESVKKGQPLLALLSTDLAEAKAAYELARLQWAHEDKLLHYKALLAREHTLSKRELIGAENSEAQSRLRLKLARDKLLIYGLSEQEIEHIKLEEGKELARMTLRAPADAIVIEVGASVGNHYAKDDALLIIRLTSIEKPAAP
jgi:RNA polymerase sigma factor (sigma-70 family)